MPWKFLTVLSTLVSICVAHPYLNSKSHEVIEGLPAGWEYHSDAHPQEDLWLRIALRYPSEPHFEVARAVSDPANPSYGQYLSAQQLRSISPDLQKPAHQVETWLRSSGIDYVSIEDDWISFQTTVQQARRLLNANFAKYSYLGAEPEIRTYSYSLPEDIKDNVAFIYPTVQFLHFSRMRLPQDMSKRQHLPPANPNCTNSVCPQQIKDLYSIDYVPPDNTSKSRVAIAGFLEQYANHEDLSTFQMKYGLKNASLPYDFSTELIHGGLNPQNLNQSGVEAALDIQYLMSFSNPLPVTFYSTGGRPPTLSQPGNKHVAANKSYNEPFLAFLQQLAAMESPPQVVSVSYSDTEQTVPLAYANRVCSVLAKLAARGISVIVASGDGGASGTGGDSTCPSPNGKTHRFLPTFPSSCEWVTSVGATGPYTPPQPASYSSGGFSNYFGVPEWQKSAASGYQKLLGKKHSGFYNSSGRGIPDVSLLGDNYLIVSDGAASPHDGTSASTPVFAAMIALINDIRLRAGKPVLGFLNPRLYSANGIAAFDDVTAGQTTGCSYGKTFEPGWQALEGWDPATGIGTPSFPKLRALLS